MNPPPDEPELSPGNTDEQKSRVQRMVRLLAALESGESWNAGKLAQHFGVTRRTIFRDVSLIREVGFTVDFDEERDAYRFVSAAGVQFFCGLTEDDWLVLAWTLEFSAFRLRGDWAERSDRLKAKLWSSLPAEGVRRLRERLRELVEALAAGGVVVATQPPAEPTIVEGLSHSSLWQQLARAIERRLVLKIVLSTVAEPITMIAIPERLSLTSTGWKLELNDLATGASAVEYPADAVVAAVPVSWDQPG